MNDYQEDNQQINNSNANMNYSYQNLSTNNKNGGKPINFKVVILCIVVLFLLFLSYIVVFKNSSRGDVEYEKLVSTLCNAAEKYANDNEGLIDKKTPGSTAYIKLQKLSEAFLIESEIEDPRYRISLFETNYTKKTIPMTAYIRLAVSSNNEVYCEGLVDTGEDTTSPIVVLSGSSEVVIAKGTNFEDPGAKANDDMDGDLSQNIVRSGTVDLTKVGEYEIEYSVTDTSGNATTIKRKIIVKEYNDLEPTVADNLDVVVPQIEIKGDNPLCLELGETYVEPGVTAIDNKDGDITGSIIVNNSITGNRTGVFRVTYTVEDSAGNKASAYRSVQVKTSCEVISKTNTEVVAVNSKPTIALIGGTAVTQYIGEEYIDRGATAWDKEDGNITNILRVDTSMVNTNLPGIYKVFYEVIDSKGLKSTTSRTVTIVSKNVGSNIATFVTIPSNIKVEVGTPVSLEEITAKDSNGKNVSITKKIVNSAGKSVDEINYYDVGNYTVVYYAKPTNGVSQSVGSRVTVVDTTAPTIDAPSSVSIMKRANNCELTLEDLINSDVILNDGLNQKKPTLRIKGSSIDICKAEKGKVTIDAIDASGNTSFEKTLNIIVVEDLLDTEDVNSVSLLNCGYNDRVDMNIGGTYQLTHKVYPSNASNQNVSWKSLNETVATVDNGIVTAAKVGSTEIIVTTEDGKKTDSCTIVVFDKEENANVPVSSVDIKGCESGEITLEKGKIGTLTAQLLPLNATNQLVRWESSDVNVASINNQGIITTIKSGKTNLKVTTEDGKKTKTCVLNVLEEVNKEDETAPSKVTLVSSSFSTTDPYNTAGTWYGGINNREIKFVVEATDEESGICRFDIISKDKVIASFNPTVSDNKIGEYIWKTDINAIVNIRAVNCADIVGEYSDSINIKLDNTGPNIKFTNSLEESKWTNHTSFDIQYVGNDNGIGLSHYEYTYDDVKTVKEPKIEGTTETGNKTFYENNIKSYVYVRAVDNLGNVGPWTEKPSYLNMDSVAPSAPGINVTNNNTSNVIIGFSFADGYSTKSSGFGSFEYKINSEDVKQLFNLNDTFNLTKEGKYKVEAWTYDNAGNKSLTSSVNSDIVVVESTSSKEEKEVAVDTTLKVTHSKTIESVKDSTATFTSNKDVSWTISDKLNYEIVTNTSRKLVIKKKYTELTGLKVSWVDKDGIKDSYNLNVNPSTPDFNCKVDNKKISDGSNVETGKTITCTTELKNATLSCSGNISEPKSVSGKEITCETSSSGDIKFDISVYGYKTIINTYDVVTPVATETKNEETTQTQLKVSCPSSSINTGDKVVCSLDKTTSYEGVSLICYNNDTFMSAVTTTSSNKTISCTPINSGELKVVARKTGYVTGDSNVVTVKGDTTEEKPTQLKVSCPSSSINTGNKVVCSLDKTTSYEGVMLTCYNNNTSVHTFTTTSSDKTISCPANSAGELKVVAEKSGYVTGNSNVVTVKATATEEEPTQLKVSCPSSDINTGKTVVCSLDSSTSYEGVKLSCYNNDTFIRSFTTTSSDKTVSCPANSAGELKVVAEKPGYVTGNSNVVTVKGDTTDKKTTEKNINSSELLVCYKNGSQIYDGTPISPNDKITCKCYDYSNGMSVSGGKTDVTYKSESVGNNYSTDRFIPNSSGSLKISYSDSSNQITLTFPITKLTISGESTISSIKGSTITLKSNVSATWKIVDNTSNFSLNKTTGTEVILTNTTGNINAGSVSVSANDGSDKQTKTINTSLQNATLKCRVVGASSFLSDGSTVNYDDTIECVTNKDGGKMFSNFESTREFITKKGVYYKFSIAQNINKGEWTYNSNSGKIEVSLYFNDSYTSSSVLYNVRANVYCNDPNYPTLSSDKKYCYNINKAIEPTCPTNYTRDSNDRCYYTTKPSTSYTCSNNTLYLSGTTNLCGIEKGYGACPSGSVSVSKYSNYCYTSKTKTCKKGYTLYKGYCYQKRNEAIDGVCPSKLELYTLGTTKLCGVKYDAGTCPTGYPNSVGSTSNYCYSNTASKVKTCTSNSYNLSGGRCYTKANEATKTYKCSTNYELVEINGTNVCRKNFVTGENDPKSSICPTGYIKIQDECYITKTPTNKISQSTE